METWEWYVIGIAGYVIIGLIAARLTYIWMTWGRSGLPKYDGDAKALISLAFFAWPFVLLMMIVMGLGKGWFKIITMPTRQQKKMLREKSGT